jgi:hypothetical protein
MANANTTNTPLTHNQIHLIVRSVADRIRLLEADLETCGTDREMHAVISEELADLRDILGTLPRYTGR